MSSPYDGLETSNIAYLYAKAMNYINNVHYDAYNYIDKKKSLLRSLDSRTIIEGDILKCCEKSSRELTMKLKSINLLEKELDEIVKILEEELSNSEIKIMKEIDDIISE